MERPVIIEGMTEFQLSLNPCTQIYTTITYLCHLTGSLWLSCLLCIKNWRLWGLGVTMQCKQCLVFVVKLVCHRMWVNWANQFIFNSQDQMFRLSLCKNLHCRPSIHTGGFGFCQTQTSYLSTRTSAHIARCEYNVNEYCSLSSFNKWSIFTIFIDHLEFKA